MTWLSYSKKKKKGKKNTWKKGSWYLSLYACVAKWWEIFLCSCSRSFTAYSMPIKPFSLGFLCDQNSRSPPCCFQTTNKSFQVKHKWVGINPHFRCAKTYQLNSACCVLEWFAMPTLVKWWLSEVSSVPAEFALCIMGTELSFIAANT